MAYFFGVDFLFVDYSDLASVGSKSLFRPKAGGAIKRAIKPVQVKRGPRFD